MTPEEIRKLAEEYAVEVTKDMAKTLDEPSCLLNETKRATKKYITDFMQWLLRTHCIVSKEKVRKVYDNANHGDAVISISKLREVLMDMADGNGFLVEDVDDIINRVKESI